MKKLLIVFLSKLPILKKIIETRSTQTPIKLSHYIIQKFLGFNRSVPWPVHHSSLVSSQKNIKIGVDTCPGYMPGCYVQGAAGIEIGDYTQISCNVGLISRNYDVYDTRKHLNIEKPSILIGKYCWLGMNVTVLPGVKLGDFTIVGAGSVVTKSFESGHCIIAGNPAKVIRTLEREKCIPFVNDNEYMGYETKSAYLRGWDL